MDKVLSPLADLTDILSGKKYITILSVKPLQAHNIWVPEREGESTQLTKDIMSTYVTRKYENEEVYEPLDVATF